MYATYAMASSIAEGAREAAEQAKECHQDPCKDLKNKIDKKINRNKRLHGNRGTHGLRYRFGEQISGTHGPGTQGWYEHDKVIRGEQRRLGELLKEWEKNKCSEKENLPPGAYDWANRTPPQPSEWWGP